MMRNLLKMLSVVLVCLCLLQCGEPCTPTGDDGPPPLSQGEQQLVSAYNAFGLKLFRELISREPPDTNLFISPVSVTMGLGMTLNGAAGTTEQAMKSTLEFSEMDMHEINQCYQSLMELLLGLDPEVQMEIANSIWYRLHSGIEQQFLQICQAYFDAQVTGMDFSAPDAASIINTWVEEKTHGKIKDIVEDPISPEVVMFLIDAIYFKGTWTYQFDPALTRDNRFTLPDGSVGRCRMMQRPADDEVCEYSYFEDDEVQVANLPYGDGWFSLVVVLPRQGVDLDQLIGRIDQNQWDTWMSSLESREGLLRMPRFETSYEIELKDALAALGMAEAFGQAADFTRMRASGGLWIGRVKHKTYVKVNEEGTEAAAATSVVMVEISNPETFFMSVDRPFIFAVREKHSGTIVFMGRIVDPGYLE